jgi:hypothetical protein
MIHFTAFGVLIRLAAEPGPSEVGDVESAIGGRLSSIASEPR